MAERYVLDTSAILAFTDGEEGSDEIERLLEAGKKGSYQLLVCSISLMELYYVTMREKGEDEAARIIALVKSWPVKWVYPDEKTLLQAGKLKASSQLSLADALIAAVAKLHKARLVHKDPEFSALAKIQLFPLPFKSKS
ncbi:type II toxin-antitoxin system VapC family toxin [Candidatus Acetothermia bacterium]|nr:type II toxin-antitoxin system VapC family toxin [Candidatus Acetothermia bacterium]